MSKISILKNLHFKCNNFFLRRHGVQFPAEKSVYAHKVTKRHTVVSPYLPEKITQCSRLVRRNIISLENYILREVLMKNPKRVWRNVYHTYFTNISPNTSDHII